MIRVAIAALFLATSALAAEPETVAEADLLRVRVLELEALIARRAWEAEAAAVRAKYKLTDGDSIDGQTRQIKRAPKQRRDTMTKPNSETK